MQEVTRMIEGFELKVSSNQCIFSQTICYSETNINNTPDWNYDKPSEWGLETLTGKTFVMDKLF